MKVADSKRLGEIIEIHRKRARLSRVELASLAGIGKTAIFDAEKGKETIKLRTLLRILPVLNITVNLDSPILREIEQHDAQG